MHWKIYLIVLAVAIFMAVVALYAPILVFLALIKLGLITQPL